MFPLLLPIVVLGIGGTIFLKSSKKGVMTPERTMVFNQAVANVKEPEKLEKLGKAFKDEGLHVQGDLLLARAKLRSATPEMVDARRNAFKGAMKSTNVPVIQKMASAFAEQGATGAAAALNNYAAGVKAGANINAGIPSSPPIATPTKPMPTVAQVQSVVKAAPAVVKGIGTFVSDPGAATADAASSVADALGFP